MPVVLDAAILDAEAVEPFAVALRMPAEMQVETGDLDRPRQVRRAAEIAGQHFAEALDAPVVNEVFDAGPFAVAAVAVIAEQLDDRLGGVEPHRPAGT